MASINIAVTVPDAQASDILVTITDALGWSAALGVTRPEYLRQQMRNWLRSVYRMAKVDGAASAAGTQAGTDADSVSFT